MNTGYSAERCEIRSSTPCLGVESPLPPELGTCLLIHEFLSPAECAGLIEGSEQRGFLSAETDYPPSYRNNDCQVLEEDALAEWLFQRLQDVANNAHPVKKVLTQQAPWQLVGLNKRLRFCRYTAGQQFHIHQDGISYLFLYGGDIFHK